MSLDTEEVWLEMQQIAREYGQIQLPTNLIKSHAKEIVRYGGSEVHTVSALIGGVAAQEAVKIITHKYIPLNNTFIYNGVVGCADTYEL